MGRLIEPGEQEIAGTCLCLGTINTREKGQHTSNENTGVFSDQ